MESPIKVSLCFPCLKRSLSSFTRYLKLTPRPNTAHIQGINEEKHIFQFGMYLYYKAYDYSSQNSVLMNICKRDTQHKADASDT